jgi:hypothetical protein
MQHMAELQEQDVQREISVDSLMEPVVVNISVQKDKTKFSSDND